jgi:hypothetical protein
MTGSNAAPGGASKQLPGNSLLNQAGKTAAAKVK